MTDTEKLNALIEYIQSAEKYAFEKTCYDNEWARVERCNGIQDIVSFIENSLGIEYKQLPIDEEKVRTKVPNRELESIKELASKIGEVPFAYLEGLGDAASICNGTLVEDVLKFRNMRKSWK